MSAGVSQMIERKVAIQRRITEREGVHYVISLWDIGGRFVLRAHAYELGTDLIEHITDYLENGVITWFAQRAVTVKVKPIEES